MTGTGGPIRFWPGSTYERRNAFTGEWEVYTRQEDETWIGPWGVVPDSAIEQCINITQAGQFQGYNRMRFVVEPVPHREAGQ
jgi:hypothetical protein